MKTFHLKISSVKIEGTKVVATYGGDKASIEVELTYPEATRVVEAAGSGPPGRILVQKADGATVFGEVSKTVEVRFGA